MRIALGLEYNGSNYYGWQSQEGLSTVQKSVEKALSVVADHPINIICAGRTDAGVHAQNQVVHFDTNATRTIGNWILGGNSNLPKDISIKWAREVASDFHARFSAVARRYRYLIYNSNTRPAIFYHQVTWHVPHLDEAIMQKASQYLIGEHDFSSLRGSGCQAKSAVRTIYHIQIKRVNKLIIMDIKANAFLLHMVRNIAGILMKIGEGERDAAWVREVLDARDRRRGGVTASAKGLYLQRIYY